MILASALASIALALVGVIYTLMARRIERLEKANLELHERVAKVEVLEGVNKDKIKEVDDRRHRYQVEQRHEHTDLHKWITESILEKLSK